MVEPTIPDVSIRPAPPCSRHSLRLRPAGVEAAAQGWGVALPTRACRASSHGERSALWLGPDEWLLLDGADQGTRVVADLGHALAGQSHALVEISDRQVGLELAGPRCAEVLNAGCPLDLGLAAFPPGMCTRTLFGKADVVLWRTGEDRFRIEVWRSFAAYVELFAWEAARRSGAAAGALSGASS